jgi:hypothetical protein
MSDQSTSRTAAYADSHKAGHELVGGKQASRRTFLKASGALIAGVAAQVSPAAAAAQGAVAADNGPRDIMKRDPQASSLVPSIAEFVHRTGFRDLPDTIRRIARQHILDTIGCCLAAARLETSRSLASYLMSEGGTGQATAISIPRQLPAPQAAFMNGLLARSLEFDDMAMPDLHPSGAIVPLVLALCEWQRASGGADDRRLRHRARALPAAGSGCLRSHQPHLPLSAAGAGRDGDLWHARRSGRGREAPGPRCEGDRQCNWHRGELRRRLA